MGPARDRLRQATADIHNALHGAAPFLLIEQGRIGHAGYGALLVLLHRYHCAMASACGEGAAALRAPELAAAHRARIARLRQDIAFLNVPLAETLKDPVRDGAFSIGCLYTVLGSTLGGKVIARQLEGLLPDGRGRSFFAGGPDDAAHWHLFCTRLEASAHPLAAVEAGARHAFAWFALLLEDWRDIRPLPQSDNDGAAPWISSRRSG